MNFKTVVSSILVAVLLCVGVSTSVHAETKQTAYVGIAYSKIDLVEIGSLNDIKVSKEPSQISVSFSLNDNSYEFDAIKFGEDETGIKYASKEANGVSFNLLESYGSMTGMIVNKKISPINLTDEDSFGFVISNTANQKQLSQTVHQVKSENSAVLKKSQFNINTLPKLQVTNQSIPQSTIQSLNSPTNLHVLASGLSIPGIISSGVSEGWAYSTHKTQQYFRVTNLQYSVAYNWPSDGVSLWYDYINSDQAFHTPAFPSAGLTSVSGEWEIDATKGMFVAETFVSVAIKGVPVGYTVYDTTQIGV